jgi:sterol desaturase/sphingolipid hydroxylase (fatty acid hydroxylase superfamily)
MLFLFKAIIFYSTSVIYALIEYFYSVMKNDDNFVEEQTKGAIYNGLVLIVTETISVLVFLFITTTLYTFVWGSIPHTTPIQIIGTIIIVDFLYYLYHRAHHANSKLFTIHRIHHVGTKYNLALAIMLPWVGQASIYLMLVPLVLLHITPLTIVSAYFFLLTYQFFCHISYLQLPRWCDIFLVTPRNHRIHHYHDRYSQAHNFGAVFSLWDRLFFTYTDDLRGKDVRFGVDDHMPIDFLSMQKETVMQFFKK